MCPNKGSCEKKGGCETCPNKMNCEFIKKNESIVKIGEKVEVEVTD